MKQQMRVNLSTWAAAMCVAMLSAAGALYLTRPASTSLVPGSAQLAGRDFPSSHGPDPLIAEEIRYQIPRDRIRAIDAPEFVTARVARFVPDRMPVIGVTDGDQAKAYPVPLLSRVEIVNDQIRGRAIAVTW